MCVQVGLGVGASGTGRGLGYGEAGRGLYRRGLYRVGRGSGLREMEIGVWVVILKKHHKDIKQRPGSKNLTTIQQHPSKTGWMTQSWRVPAPLQNRRANEKVVRRDGSG